MGRRVCRPLLGRWAVSPSQQGGRRPRGGFIGVWTLGPEETGLLVVEGQWGKTTGRDQDSQRGVTAATRDGPRPR